MIDSFIFHRSYFEAVECLPPQSQCNVIQCICEYALNGKETELEGVEKAVWKLIKPTLDSSISRYKASVENGKKGGRPKANKTQSKPNNNLTKTQTKPNQNLNKDKDKDKDMDKDMDKDTTLSGLFDIFQSPDYAKNRIFTEWLKLTESEKRYAFRKGNDYIKYERSRGYDNHNLMYYLKDRKWEWDLTIQRNNRKIPNEELPDHLKVWKA